ncbi:MAG: hypothetical protein HKN09_01220 [Saprospiraceae bacterium]|nr:hypothetical protein [Saprospiraceae bacterium]
MVVRLLKQYITSWKFAFTAWPFLLLLWGLNLTFALLVINPLNYGLKKAFGNTLDLSTFLQGFDYTLIMDFLREYDVAVGAAFDQSVLIILISILLQVFLTGGIVHLVISRDGSTRFRDFWAQCSNFSMKYLSLSVMLMIVTGIIFMLLFMFFSKDGFNPFFFENELVLIHRFWWLLTLGLIFLFWLSIFRDAAKIEIYRNSEAGFFKNILSGLRKSITIPFILNGLLNTIVFVIMMGIFFSLRPQLDLFGWTLIALSQAWLILRIVYRIGRLRSFALLP